jgi:hypothetical protein
MCAIRVVLSSDDGWARRSSPQVQPIESQRQTVIEAAAIGNAVRLIDDHPAYRHLQAETQAVGRVVTVDADRMTIALIVVDRLRQCEGMVEITRAIQGQHRAELFTGEWKIAAGTGFFHQQKACADELAAR